jgi:hypothetical protein
MCAKVARVCCSAFSVWPSSSDVCNRQLCVYAGRAVHLLHLLCYGCERVRLQHHERLPQHTQQVPACWDVLRTWRICLLRRGRPVVWLQHLQRLARSTIVQHT